MDFDDSPEEVAFRDECFEWLSQNAQLRSEGAADAWRTLRPRGHEEEVAARKVANAWQATKADAGYAGIDWPESHGGRGLPHTMAAIYKREEAKFDVPANAFQVGVEMVGPTLVAHGTEEQQNKHMDRIRRGEDFWCQLFSEPGAGSDLAALSTSAVVDGDQLIVNGQKLWTSSAHLADWGILLVRTNLDSPKHRGITCVLLDMTTEGIDIRPLRQIDGAADFNEVFFNDVAVPLENVVGELDHGWGVALTTLTAERSAIGGGGMVQFREVLMLAEAMGVTKDPVVRQEIARSFTNFELSRYMGYRVQTSLSRGEMPGPESSVMKLHISRQYEHGGDLYTQMMGAAGTLWHEDAPLGGFFQDMFLSQWAPRLGGGTDQVQRNIVGERVLGLPPETRTDKAIPFRDHPR